MAITVARARLSTGVRRSQKNRDRRVVGDVVPQEASGLGLASAHPVPTAASSTLSHAMPVTERFAKDRGTLARY